MARPQGPLSIVRTRFVDPYVLAWAMNSPNVGIWENLALTQAASGATRISGVGIFTPRFLMWRPKLCRGSEIFDRLNRVQNFFGARRAFLKGLRPFSRLTAMCPTIIRSRS